MNQIVGYIMSGDPTYITSHKNARSMIMKVERDELVEELLKEYIRNRIMGTEVRLRVLGLDYGSKTVGVAVSDGLGFDGTGRGDHPQDSGEQAAQDAGAGSKN